MSELIKLQVYRHKEFKEVYLKRTNFCGGSETTQFYACTEDLLEAIKNYEAYGEKEFLRWLHSFPNNYTVYTRKMEFEWDGYKGTLCKEFKLFVKDFELVTLEEVKE